MDVRPVLALVTGMLVLPVCLAQSPTLNLYTFEAPPYQVASGPGLYPDKITGETVDTVTCAALKAGWQVRIRMAPQNRAIHSLRRNMVDGYFAIDPSTELGAVASISHPVALEKWYFYTLTPVPVSDNARIGVVDGSNEEAWLKSHGYTPFMTVSSPEQLIALLKKQRIDTALMDQRVMEDLRLSSQVANGTDLHAYFLRYAPLYLYLGRQFTENHPDFLSSFNRFLPECMTTHLALSRQESLHIHRLSSRLLQDLNSTIDLQGALARAPEPGTLADILTADSKWQAQAPAATDLAETLLSLPASRALSTWQRSRSKLITEVMVINRSGALSAMSRLTSDYWQGDETKFRYIMEHPRDSRGEPALYISNIRYDVSTARFQVNVSAALIPAPEKPPNGVIVLGLDIGEALYQGTHPPMAGRFHRPEPEPRIPRSR